MAKKELLKEYEGDESNKKEVSRSDFPPNFVFGVATSAYQVLSLPSPLYSHFLVCLYLYSDKLWSGYSLIFTVLL